MTAATHAALPVARLAGHGAGFVVPLGFAGDDRPAGRVPVGVEVVVAFGGFPAEEST